MDCVKNIREVKKAASQAAIQTEDNTEAPWIPKLYEKVDYKPTSCAKSPDAYVKGMVIKVEQQNDMKSYKLSIKHECSQLEDTNIHFPDNPSVAKCASNLLQRSKPVCLEIDQASVDWTEP